MSEVTLAKCGMCGQYYQASEHHKCLLKPTQSNVLNAINKATEDAKKPQLIKPLWIEEFEKQIRADAIEDCINTMQKMFEYTDSQGLPHYALYAWINLTSIRDTLEQLKEKKND